MLKAFLASCPSCTILDPAVEEKATLKFCHLMRWCEIAELRNTHSNVATKFRNGPFKGTQVEHLSSQLLNGSIVPSDLPPLVAVRFGMGLFVVCGNRRTRALQDFAAAHVARTDEALPKVRVIVHDFPLDHIRDPSLRCAFLAKSVLASTTTNGGKQADLGDAS